MHIDGFLLHLFNFSLLMLVEFSDSFLSLVGKSNITLLSVKLRISGSFLLFFRSLVLLSEGILLLGGFSFLFLRSGFFSLSFFFLRGLVGLGLFLLSSSFSFLVQLLLLLSRFGIGSFLLLSFLSISFRLLSH